jgi:hypothetical protein
MVAAICGFNRNGPRRISGKMHSIKTLVTSPAIYECLMTGYIEPIRKCRDQEANGLPQFSTPAKVRET